MSKSRRGGRNAARRPRRVQQREPGGQFVNRLVKPNVSEPGSADSKPIEPPSAHLDLRVFVHLAPAEWFGKDRLVHLSCYRTLRIPTGGKPGPSQDLMPILIRPELHAYLYDGSVGYYTPDMNDFGGVFPKVGEAGFEVRAGHASLKRSELGIWLVIIQPYRPTNDGRALMAARQCSRSAAAACAVLYGRAVPGRLLAENIVGGKDVGVAGKYTVAYEHGPYVLYGSYFEEPAFNESTAEFDPASAAVDSLRPSRRKRLVLALQWYERSVQKYGIEAFLDVWIALEVVVASHGKSILGVHRLLASHYGLSDEETVERFHIGRVYDLRNRIVHGGYIQYVGPFVVDYASLVFRDVVRAYLELPLKGFAAKALERKTSDALHWLGKSATSATSEDVDVVFYSTQEDTYDYDYGPAPRSKDPGT